ncbi:putative F-box domain-containing protein [Helianthus annuus]|nr:putative F-box domain-containing protein [Helianthus annuus]KAJ0679620.1 putative F-box domain-containing protein [Helianthus annuus]
MSDNIPFELQEIIMKKLPVEPLIRFRSVCKAWKSLIDSSDFIRNHITQQKQQHLLVRYHSLLIRYKKYVSIADIDDDTDTDTGTDTIPPSVVNLVAHHTDSSHGLLCSFSETDRKAVIWNPSIRKAVDVVLPDMADDEMYTIVLGFGVCRETTDPKIIKIRISSDVEGLIPWQVEVFTLSARVWRSTYSSNVPSKFVIFDEEQVVVGGVVYWLANDRVGAEDGHDNLIVSFDLTSEEFGEVKLPDRLAYNNCRLCMFKPRESPVVIEGCVEDYKRGYHVWVMKDGVPKLFEKLFTISGHTPDGSLVSSVLGFRKTGEALVELQPYGSVGTLAAYEPYSKAFSNLGVSGRYISVYSYTKTLLLL